MDRQELDILLLGRSGSGLSSTCKSLTGEEGIEVRGGWTPITPGFQIGECTTGGRTLRVVDTPGVVDENAARALLMERAVTEAFQAVPDGFHAIGLVISYSSRVTVDFASFIKDLKSILRDDDWLKKYGVVIITGGDNFHRDYKGMDMTMTFEQWCEQQRGIIQSVFQECNSRYVLFDNVTNDDILRDRQRQELISLIDELDPPPFVRPVADDSFIGRIAKWIFNPVHKVRTIVVSWIALIISLGLFATKTAFLLFSQLLIAFFNVVKWMLAYPSGLLPSHPLLSSSCLLTICMCPLTLIQTLWGWLLFKFEMRKK